jgi:hypothetical protein
MGGGDPDDGVAADPGHDSAADAVASGEDTSVAEERGRAGGRAPTAAGPDIVGEAGADGNDAASAAVAGIVREAAEGALSPSGEGVPCTVCGTDAEARTEGLDTGTEGEVGAGERAAGDAADGTRSASDEGGICAVGDAGA